MPGSYVRAENDWSDLVINGKYGHICTRSEKGQLAIPEKGHREPSVIDGAFSEVFRRDASIPRIKWTARRKMCSLAMRLA